MCSVYCVIVLALCLFQAIDFSDAFHKRHMSKRFHLQKNRDPNKPKPKPIEVTDGYIFPRGILFNNGSINGGTQEGFRFEDVALVCNVGGIPAPSVHWLKDGKRISQEPGSCKFTGADEDEDGEALNVFGENKLSLYRTRSKLFIDCLDETDQGNYTCVGESAFHRETRSIYLTVARAETPSTSALTKCASKGRPARIYMSTFSIMELEDNNVRFFCRAQGTPKPQITWLDRMNKTIQDGGHFKIDKSGDLIIKKIRWMDHMGMYTCRASNAYGTDEVAPFLYPTGRE